MGGNSGDQFNLTFAKGPVKILFSVLPADFDGDWHENPEPQWILPIAGGWWVETQDGKRIELREGDLSFGGDQNTSPDKNGNRGHRSGVLDGKPCKMMIVQLLDANQAPRPKFSEVTDVEHSDRPSRTKPN